MAITINLNLSTTNVTEGTNLYFTTSRVLGTTLGGLSITGGSIVSTDTVLQAFGKTQNQINGLLGGAMYQGVWNASTNSPALASGVGTKGYYYVVNVNGTTNLDGITDWKVGDWAIFNGTTWDKVDNTDAVSSVNGAIGAVSIAITGTTNRIDVSGGTGTTPTIDIASTYIGQTSITTLGTITTGTLGSGIKILLGSDATGDMYYNSGSGTTARLAAGAAGTFLRYAGTGTAPTASTLVLPNSATVNRIPFASATNTWSDSASLLYVDANPLLVINSTTANAYYNTNMRGIFMSPTLNVFHNGWNPLVSLGQGGALFPAIQIYSGTSGAFGAFYFQDTNFKNDTSSTRGNQMQMYSYNNGSNKTIFVLSTHETIGTGGPTPIIQTLGKLVSLGAGGTASPLDLVVFAPGTTSLAPIGLTSGPLTTGGNIRVGQLQFLTDNLYFTGTTGTTVKTIADYSYRAITALRTLDGSDELVNITSGTFAVTLPTAVGYTKEYTIKNSGSGTITLNTTSSQTIDGNASGVLTLLQYEYIRLRSDGANWLIIG